VQIVNAQDFEQSQQQQMDATLLVKFFERPRPDRLASLEAGRPMFKDVEFIEIRTPGNRDAICRPARQRDIERFPKHYQAYKDRVSTDHLEGTPLSEWPLMARSRVEELAFHNVKTVEQLAGMPDSNVAQFMGMNVLKQKAKQWLEQAKDNRASVELHEELEKRDGEIAELKKAVKALTEAQAASPKPAAQKKSTRKKTSRKKVSAKKE
jgi:hypothetical protein